MTRNIAKSSIPAGGLFLSPGRSWISGAVGLGVLTALLGAAQPPQQVPSANADNSKLFPDANGPPSRNDSARLSADETGKQNLDAARAGRDKQIEIDTAKLLELATQLKAEVDKTNKDTLSINVIRKADSIEKLAKGVKDEIKLTAGAK